MIKGNIKQTVLEKYWGYSSFRPLQEGIIDDILEGKDVIALMPTGGGKSICFQVPAVLSQGGVIVVSPLIALIEDQIKSLNEKGVVAYGISSNSSTLENERAISRFISGQAKLIYVAPERLESRSFIEQISYAKLSFVAIDEAHCISEWGYDFRPSYLNISRLREIFPRVNFAAFTATATSEVVEDICKKLKFHKPYRIHRSSFERPNIRYMVSDNPNIFQRISNCLSGLKSGSAIIYTRSRAKAREVASLFQGGEITADYYHAGRSIEERKFVQQQWLEEKIKVIVATTAFGMGIDKPDVRYVFHWDIPETVESYFQEAGRAGRDGKEAYALLFDTPQRVDQLFYPIENPLYGVAELKKVYYALFSSWSSQAVKDSFFLYPETFAERCGISLRQLRAILSFMEHRRLLKQTYDRQSSIKFIKPAGEVQKWIDQEMEHFEFLDVLQRRLNLAFLTPQKISESDIALWTRERVHEVLKKLRKLHHHRVIVYQNSSSCAKILMSHRQASPDMLESLQTAFKRNFNTSRQRRRAVYKFIRSNKCRSSWLLEYFGESPKLCGQCDVCLEHDELGDLEKHLKEVLHTKKNIHQIISEMPQFHPHRINQTLYKMLMEERKEIESSDGLYWSISFDKDEYKSIN